MKCLPSDAICWVYRLLAGPPYLNCIPLYKDMNDNRPSTYAYCIPSSIPPFFDNGGGLRTSIMTMARTYWGERYWQGCTDTVYKDSSSATNAFITTLTEYEARVFQEAKHRNEKQLKAFAGQMVKIRERK